jgi:aspartate ammonia-lyase
MPIRLGQEFTAYAATVARARVRLARAVDDLRDLGIGGTAVGTGVNTEPGYAAHIVQQLRDDTGLALREGADRVQLMQSMGDVAAFHALLRVFASDVAKIANDLRLMASGPRTGLNEIHLPAVQPGSSIMPGKVNPSIVEMVNQVCLQVLGNDATVSAASERGELELNVMMPVIAHNVLFSITIFGNALGVLADKCVSGIAANREQAAYWVERSAALATALAPVIGYAKAAELAKRSVDEGVLIRDLVTREQVLPPDELARLLDLARLTRADDA